MDNIQKLNELRDGVFQVAMLLYSEYVKYMSEADARACVFNDLIDKAKAFVEKPIDDITPDTIVAKALENKSKQLLATYKTLRTADEKITTMDNIEALEKAAKILKG